jgi:hypothetical protein
LWQLLDCEPAWDGNWTDDCFIAFAWQAAGQSPLIIVVNYAPNQSQCHVRLPFPDLSRKTWCLHDAISGQQYSWNGDDLAGRGLFVDHASWQSAVFTLVPQ